MNFKTVSVSEDDSSLESNDDFDVDRSSNYAPNSSTKDAAKHSQVTDSRAVSVVVCFHE